MSAEAPKDNLVIEEEVVEEVVEEMVKKKVGLQSPS